MSTHKVLKANTQNQAKYFCPFELDGIAVIVVMAAMLLLALNATQKKSHVIKCNNNLKQIELLEQMYSNDYDNYVVLAWIARVILSGGFGLTSSILSHRPDFPLYDT